MAKTDSKWHRPELEHSRLVAEIPMACQDETCAVEFLERQRWGDSPCCIHCGSVNVYKMTSTSGGRNKRFLWRCRDCKEQYTVRVGTVYEESRIELRHWCYAFWRAATSKKGVAALEIMRQCQIRFAMAPDPTTAPKLDGIVEVDEVYIGGKPRKGTGPHKRGKGTKKQPVFVAVERNGNIRRRVVPNVNGATLKDAIRELVNTNAQIMSDENTAYNGLAPEFASHETVCHGTGEYARGNVHTNTAESSNALVKRGIVGIYHNVSKEHLHRYLWQFDFVWNHRQMNDGDRTVATIKAAEGKRLMYKTPVGN
jgi:transposase-like protein